MMTQSTKDKIISLAQADPFLTVEQIAEQSETTPRYVRTILSEARISLTKLRREYARSMERQLAGRESNVLDLELPVQTELHFAEIHRPEYCSLLDLSEDKMLFEVNHITTIADISAFVQLITDKPLTVKPRCTSLQQLLPDVVRPVTAREQWAEVLEAPDNLAHALHLIHNKQVFRICTLLQNEDGPVALEYQWIPVEGVSLRWSGKPATFQISANG